MVKPVVPSGRGRGGGGDKCARYEYESNLPTDDGKSRESGVMGVCADK